MTSQKENAVDEQLIDRRIRNRIIENLETISLATNWKKIGANEIINLWYDFVPDYSVDSFPLETYTQEERDAIHSVCEAVERLTTTTPRELPTLELLACEPEWKLVLSTSKKALDTLLIRGRFAEDV